MTTRLLRFLLVGALAALSAAAARAVSYSEFIAPSFTGTTDTDGWFDLNTVNFGPHGSYPGTDAWPSPLGSNQSGSGDATWDKVSGAGYLTGASSNLLYSPDPVGTFAIADATPVSGLANLLFQISSTGDLGASGVLLSFNGGAQNLAATSASLLLSGTVSTAFGPATQYVWAYQWDLSSFGAITDYSLAWTTAATHELTFGARLDQSSVYSAAIPEPSTYAALGGLGALVFALIRRRRAQA
jgi:hypothetical protein